MKTDFFLKISIQTNLLIILIYEKKEVISYKYSLCKCFVWQIINYVRTPSVFCDHTI